jgi:histone acetyltransferase 1
LVQYLNVRYKDKLFHNATVDDVENTLAKFIPPGEHPYAPSDRKKGQRFTSCKPIDYYKDETEFLKRVEEDAENFKPFGELVSSYTRPVETIDSKEPTEDAIEFEVYHVSRPAKKKKSKAL